MKQLILKLILPLTVISFTIFTKWWYVLPVDAPDTMMIGFPIPYACDGWHTSLSLQIFCVELVIDLLAYFSFWFVVVFSVNRFLIKIRLHKLLSVVLLSTTGLLLSGMALIAYNHNTNIFYIKRPFDIEILMTGYKFVWSGNVRPENFDFDEHKRKEGK